MFVKTLSFLLAVCFACSCAEKQETKRIPIIYSSDLFNPPADPDDHYDLATLFLMPEFDVKAFIFDVSNHSRKAEEFGRVPLEQIAAITGRPVPPYAVGLRQRLASPDDQAKEQAAQFQGGVELILKSLRESDEKVVMFLTGSCIDFAAAYNRDPELLRQKVSAVYISAGNGPSGKQNECNAGLDPNAYICLLESGLPVYWCPCIPNGDYRQATKEDVLAKNDNTYNTCFIVPNQAECLKNVSAPLRNFFNYALTASTEDPVQYLSRTPEEVSTKERWMWSTPAFFHAAGRKIYARQDGASINYIACSPQEAKKMGISDKEVEVYAFAPIQLSQTELEAQERIIQGNLNVKESSVKVFHYIHPDYNDIMGAALSNIFETHEHLPVSVIFDTDIGPDYGDVGALTILHALADSGELKILATVSCNMFELSAPCIDLTNRYYGHPDIPVGAPLTGPNEAEVGHDKSWTKALVNKYPHQLKSSADAEDAVKVYRRVLATQPDTSVVIVTTGFFTNLGALLQSSPDQYSPLDGKQLVAKKVKFLSSMAGAFPAGREYNVYVDAPASVIVFEQWPTRIVFSGYEIGFKIPSGDRLVASDKIDSPCHESYAVCARDSVKKAYLGLSWDQTSVLVAARGVDRYFNSVKGKATIAPDGSNGWEDDPNGKHEYLTWKASPEYLTTVIEDLMMHEPVKKSKN